MVSQHPDHASTPYWLTSPYIRNQDEIGEAHSSFFDLGVSEYKWDWEGKFVDEAVVERLFSEYYNDFKRAPLGKEKFLTFRLPNPKVETEFRLGRAFMGILGAAGLAEKTHLYSPPLFEVILPMTESAEEMIAVQEAFQEIASLRHPLLKMEHSSKLKQIEVIPLFEQNETMMSSDAILQQYIDYHIKAFGNKPEYIRPYVARSDPALNAGLVSTVLSIKIALSRYATLAEKTGVAMYPIIGSASLPFRGGLTPFSTEQFVHEYRGVRTALLQSAFRYDYPLKDVRKAIQQLEQLMPQTEPVRIDKKEEAELRDIITTFSQAYVEVIEGVAEEINTIADILPKRRERVQHTGLFGYSRGVGKVRLPRAIGFTAALYSLGVPPEFIGTGRALQQVKNRELVEKYFITFKSEIQRAGRYINKNNLAVLAKKSLAWKLIKEDIEALEAYLGHEFQPETSEEKEHETVTGQILNELEHHSVSVKAIEEAALLRHSLG